MARAAQQGGGAVADPHSVSLEADDDGRAVPHVGPGRLGLALAAPIVHLVANGVLDLGRVGGSAAGLRKEGP